MCDKFMCVGGPIKMRKVNTSVSGCVLESPVARSTATLVPNVGLYATRDADRQVERELMRMMEDLLATYEEDGAATRRELEVLLRQVEREALMAERQPARW